MNNSDKYRELFNKSIKGRIISNAKMPEYVTYRCGGTVALMIMPKDINDIINAVNIAKKNNVAIYVMGGGANIIPDDGYIDAVILRIAGSFNNISINGEYLEIEAGAFNADTALFCTDNGIANYWFMYDIPGTAGGLCYMNAGNEAGSFEDIVHHVQWLDLDDMQVKIIAKTDMKLEYRSSLFREKNGIILKIFSKIDQRVSPGVLREQMLALKEKRHSRFPMEYPNGGSVFKRPQGDYAGRLIEASGCGALMVGDAIVSKKHHGFIVNTGNASSADIRNLIKLVQDRVFEYSGIKLEREQIDFP